MMNQSDGPSKNDLRSARTRERILEAAISCIYELGLQNTSTVDITKRAGISRGALLHHYPSKEELLGAAYEAVLQHQATQLRDVAGDYATGSVTLDDFIDYLWSRFSVQTFAITMDYFVAARTDPGLKTKVLQARQDYDNALKQIWRQCFANENISDSDVETTLNLTLSLFRGMGLQQVMQADRSELNFLVIAWKKHLKDMLSQTVS